MPEWLNVDKPLFSFQYGDRDFAEIIPECTKDTVVREWGHGEEISVTYRTPDNLEVCWTIRTHPDFGAVKWFLTFCNAGEQSSQRISQLWDCNATTHFDYVSEQVPLGFNVPASAPRVYRTVGSNWERGEFAVYSETLHHPSVVRSYACTGGRSSQGLAPYFDVNQGNSGLLCAIGWSGQWNAVFCEEEGHQLRVKTGIEGVSLRLMRGESIRTSSVLLLRYDNGQENAHNTFRRLMKRHYSLIGRPGRPQEAPLCAGTWGSMPSDKMVSRIEAYARYGLGIECLWIDAAWYGVSQLPCPSEHSAGWYEQTGNWTINPYTHPDALKDVAKACRENGMGLLLWVEPERVIKGNPTPEQHPEWFLKLDESNANWLLDLGNEEALQYAIDEVGGLVEQLDLCCYRQDFNMDPLPYWKKYDEPERSGIHEIKHIMGLYRFWDTLLEKFPHLLIDNCASGGRRLDFEALSRSVALWRSDYQCVFDSDPETAQIHGTGFPWWLPYSGTGVGRVMGDTYRMRSCYGTSLTVGFWMYEDVDIGDGQPIDLIKRQLAEYKRVRPYLSCDFYRLVDFAMDDSAWTAWQYDRPEEGDGVILLFRRPASPFDTLRTPLKGLEPEAVYCFTDADTGEEWEQEGNGTFVFTLPERRSSKVVFYRRR